MSSKGRLIIFEGADGVGKTTLSRRAANKLAAQGVACSWQAFPGKTPRTVGSLVYQVHHSPESCGIDRLTPSSLQALHIAAHLDAIEASILPQLEAGTDVVLDRYWWSTWVYGIVSGITPSILRPLIEAEKSAWGDFSPTAVFLVTRDHPLRETNMHHWSSHKRSYEELAAEERSAYPVYVIENQRSIEDTETRIMSLLA